MNANDRQQLEYLRSRVECNKKFACLKSKFRNMCNAEFTKESHELICLEDRKDRCKFAAKKGEMLQCTCELRIFIEQNLDQWITTGPALLSS